MFNYSLWLRRLEVTVNSVTAYRKNEYFRNQLSVTNTSAAVWDSVTVAATGQTSVIGHVYVAQNPENYTYDADGNLLSDGRWTNTWDAENRLLSMTSLTGAPTGSLLQLQFTYDYQGRRMQKMVSTNNGSSYIGEYTNNYAYDGWNCLVILNPSLSLSNSFLWGTDLSGSLQSAGGVGGLLKVAYYGTTTTNCFVAYDGNGNVSALINASNGATLANYEYGPFGELIRATGPMAKLNPFRFSTKYQDDETDLDYYGYRFYNPSTGRWLSRDLLSDEVFFTRLVDAHRKWTETDLDGIVRSALGPCYAFINNDPADSVDQNGLDQIKGGGQVTMGLRHHNQVVFYATCPKCTKFVLDGIDYQYVYADLVAHGVSAEALNNIPPGNPPSNLGSLAPGSPNGVNCDGKNVLIAVYMRSRLAWTGAAQMYADDTIINYHCAPCPSAK